jgi:hypothetical protein
MRVIFLTAKFAKGFLCWVLMGLVFNRKVRKGFFMLGFDGVGFLTAKVAKVYAKNAKFVFLGILLLLYNFMTLESLLFFF